MPSVTHSVTHAHARTQEKHMSAFWFSQFVYTPKQLLCQGKLSIPDAPHSTHTVIYLNKFDEQEAESSLDWTIQFWKSQREAIPTSNPNKCRTCEYKKECND